MAQLSRLAQLYLKISDNLTEDDVRNLRSLLSLDEVLGKAKVEKATPLEIFNMLVDNATIGKGNLGFLVQVLRCLGKGKFADEAELLEREHKTEEKELHDATAKAPESSASEDAQRTNEQGEIAVTVKGDSASEDSDPADTEVKEIISVETVPGASTTDYQQTEEAPDDQDVHCVTSELASLHIRELVRLRDEPMKTPGLWTDETDASADCQDARARLKTILAELDTPVVMKDQEKQFHLYSQIGDLYRAKLYDLQSALQYYQSMLECAKTLSEDVKQAKAHNRLGLTYDMLGKIDEALRNHKRVLDICKAVEGGKLGICVAHKNFASSLTLSGKVSDAKTNYKTALRLARETRNHIEEIDIHCKLGDLQYKQLKDPQIAHRNFTKMLSLAKDSGIRYWEMLAYSRLGNVCSDIQDNELALEWHQKALKMSHESGDKRDQINLHMNVAVLLGKVDQAKSHLGTALQMAEAKGEQYGQMAAYMCMGDLQREQLHSPYTSIQYYEQALALARQLGDRRQEGWVYSRLGHAHVEQREYEEALGWYEKHLRVSREREDKKEEVTAHTALGNVYRLLGQLDQATSHFNTALQMAQQTGDLHGEMNVYCKMEQLHSPRTAIPYYEQALALARQLGDRREEGVAYSKLGWARYDFGEYQTALEWFRKFLKICEEREDKKQQITAHSCLGRTYGAQGEEDQAASHLNTALQIAQQTGDLQGQIEAYFSMGEIQRNQLHSPRTSIQYYEQYLALARQLGNKYKERVAYNRLGLAHSEMREYETALEWHQKDLKASEESGDKKDQINAIRNVGNVFRLLGKVDQAASNFNTALQMAQQTGDQRGQMDVYFCLGELQKDQLHSPRTSIQYYEQALALARQLGDRYEEGLANNRLGLAYVKVEEYEEALEWHQKYLKISEERGDKKQQMTAHTAVGIAYTLLGKVDQATSHLETALQMAQQTDRYKQMDVYFSMGEMQRELLKSPRTSIQYYEKHLALARKLRDRHKEGVAYNKLGLAHYDMEEYQLALEWHQKTLKTWQGHVDKKQQIVAHLCVGETYSKLGKVDEATSHFDTALQMAQQTGDQQGQMQVYCKMGEMQREQLHSPRTAIQYYEQALKLARQLGNSHEEGLAYNKLGLAHYDKENYKAALDLCEKNLKLNQESGKMEDQTTALTNIAACYQKLCSLDQAIHYFQSAITLTKETGNKQKLICIYRDLGDLYLKDKHVPQASHTCYTEMMTVAKELERKEYEGAAYTRLGGAHFKMGEYEEALECDKKDLEIRQEIGDKANLLITHKNMAVTYTALGKPDLARSHYQSALTLAMETGNKQQQMDIYCKLGDLHLEQLHEAQVSHNHYTEMLALAVDLERKDKEGQAYNKLGIAHYRMREYETGLEWLQKFLEMSKETGDRKEEIDAHKNIAVTYQALVKLNLARSHYQSAMTIAVETENKQEQEDIAKELASL